MTRMMILLAALLVSASAGASDNDVSWGTVSHLVRHDLRPLVPMGGESFEVRVQASIGDLTAMRVGYSVDGGATAWVDGSVSGVVGPSDVWSATIPETMGDGVSYVVELIDGTDVDYLGADGVSDVNDVDPFGVDFVTLEHARMGATPVEGGAVFRVWSPSRHTCHVRGEFNNWTVANSIPKVGEDFIGFVPNAEPGDMFKFFFNNTHWVTDPHASALNTGDNFNAIVPDPFSYQWEHDGFVAAPMEEWVIYQLHVGSFAGRNDPMGATGNPSGYRDVGDRAAHLAELGVNCVMLNPINEFPGSLSGGYNPVSVFAWEGALGSPDDLKYMVDALHGAGIAVILDVVWNHVSPSDNFLWNFDGTQLYFDSTPVDTPWGAQADFNKPGVREYYLESVHHVMGEYRMDGYRHDAVMAMTDSGWTPQWSAGQVLMQEMNASIERRYPDAGTIAEIYIDSSWVQTGIGFDSQYHNAFKNDLRSSIFSAAFGFPNVQQIANVIDGSNDVSGVAVMNYFELHDDAWPLNGHERAVRNIDTTFPHDDIYARGRTTLANAIVLTSKGIPAILQGTEWLENDGWEANKIDWAHKSAYSGVFDFYAALVEMRVSESALHADADVWVYHVNEGDDVVAFERWVDGGKSFVVVMNLSDDDYSDYRLGLPRSGTWGVALDSQDLAFGGSGVGTSGAFAAEAIQNGPHAQSALLTLPAMSVMILEHDPSGQCEADFTGDGELDFFDLSAFIMALGSMDPGADLTMDGAWDFFDISAYLTLYGQGCP